MYSKCKCGAITFYADNRSEAYSVFLKNRKKFFPDADLRTLKRLPESFCCDHCVNHYGVDLCDCGSGLESIAKSGQMMPGTSEANGAFSEFSKDSKTLV